MLEDDVEPTASDLSKKMNQPLQKTIQSLQRMHYQKQIVYSSFEPLKITETGKQMARYIIARDELIEEFLKLLHIEENLDSEKESMAQYLSTDSLEKIEKFVMFSRKYPEISKRFDLLLQIEPDTRDRILPPLPKMNR